MSIESVNPATGEAIASYDEMDRDQATEVVEAAHRAFLGWRERSFAERARLMHAAADVLRERAREFARLMTQEMGKPLEDGVSEANKCALGCDYFADKAEGFLAPEPGRFDAAAELGGAGDGGSGGAARAFVTFQPLGVVLSIMPWNFPFWQVFRFAAPALMAGNATVLKHSSTVPGCALAIEEVFRQAGFPEDLFRTLMMSSSAIEPVLEHPHVRAVTLTGSEGAGRKVASKAGELLKKSVLELGGSDAYLVLEDADLEHAADVCAAGRLVNSGQSCIAAKRFLVVEAVRERFEELFVQRMQRAKMGDPMEPDTRVGPMARADLRDDLHRQVEASVEAGARLLCGGAVPDGPGAFYPPTVLTDVRPGMAAFDEEVFGPIAAIVPVADEDEAVRLANASRFGLGGGVLTRDLERGERLAAQALEAGMVFVNHAVQSTPSLPFGGVKNSGYGRELAAFGIREFVNVKTVAVFEAERGGGAGAGRSE